MRCNVQFPSAKFSGTNFILTSRCCVNDFTCADVCVLCCFLGPVSILREVLCVYVNAICRNYKNIVYCFISALYISDLLTINRKVYVNWRVIAIFVLYVEIFTFSNVFFCDITLGIKALCNV